MLSPSIVYSHVCAWIFHYQNKLNNPMTLEAGSGAGQYAKFFPRDKYTSFDISQSWYETVHPPSVLASSDALPFESHRFDFIFSVAAFDYFPNPVKTLQEFSRCLKKDGVFLMVTYDQKTLSKIHQNAKKLSHLIEYRNHHVYDETHLYSYAKNSGFTTRRLPLYPPPSWRGLLPIHWRWRYFRQYELAL